MKRFYIVLGFVLTVFFAYSVHTGLDFIESIANIGSDNGPVGQKHTGRGGSSRMLHK